MSSAERTTDHKVIRKWVEDRKGRPSIVERTGSDKRGGGVLRIDFAEPDAALEEIDWDRFFAIFDESELAFLHQDKTADGKVSRFNKFVSRSGSDDDA